MAELTPVADFSSGILAEKCKIKKLTTYIKGANAFRFRESWNKEFIKWTQNNDAIFLLQSTQLGG